MPLLDVEISLLSSISLELEDAEAEEAAIRSPVDALLELPGPLSLTMTTGICEFFNLYLNIPAPEYGCLYLVFIFDPTINTLG